jgi:branched-chain amino acid transport system substrate-binding protein
MASRAAAVALCGLATLAGCSSGSEEPDADASLAVYVSLPLRGPQGAGGRDARDGAKLALADAGGQAAGVSIEAQYLDDTDGRTWTPEAAAANARAASEDSTAIAYLGDFTSGATRASLPVTNEAHLLQVSPASGAVDLVAPDPGSDELPGAQPSGERSFGRVIPADDAQARGAAGWVERLGVRRVATLSDGTAFGDVLVDEFSIALEGVDVTRRDDPQLLYFGGTADREPASAVRGFPQGLMASDAVLEPDAVLGQPDGTRATSAALDPSQLPPAGREFTTAFEERYGRRAGRYAAYGYEAMAVILDSIERASDPTDREAVVDAFFETADRDSVLGRYSIDEVGDTTLERLSGYRIERGRPRPAAELSSGP